ncbi:exosortase XrtF [Flavobacterium akiainvivens]|uniref:Exosortase XrtF n=1 Tax=Flavobacterium akiainvivens TaxID=1202724 RepID=A0A0M9VK28_9FLAO|nr:exosortase family protein XrtF [Flavobacterium akiainvivens]KOS08412.1 exosortase XrtF [Flavobacterium akiainvivens]SFQ26062.1 exosortase family protein XrtF [Flavobacterium akiainvivens]
MNAFQKNKPFFIFLAKFGGTYLVLALIYSFYLSRFDAEHFEPDGVTTMVSKQSAWLANAFGEEARVEPHTKEASYKFFLNGRHMVRIVEGCNAVSVMILFAAFVVAFSSTFKRTVLYIFCGTLVIHLLNVLRIALLCMALFYYKDWGPFLHDILFPLFIYGVVMVLWILWVAKFRGNEKK